MKALELLQYLKDGMRRGYRSKHIIDNTIKEIEVLTNENKSLVKTLEKYNEEMIELRKENQELKNATNNY